MSAEREVDAAVAFRYELTRLIRESLRVTEADATTLAERLERSLWSNLGGRYVPQREMRALRDAAVRRAFNGRNKADVIREFGISQALFYQIVGNSRNLKNLESGADKIRACHTRPPTSTP